MARRRLTVFDSTTGEVVGLQVTKPQSNRPRYTYVGGFMIISIDGLSMIRKSRITLSSTHVLYLLLGQMVGNQVIIPSLRQMADTLGMDAPAVSRAISKLESAGILTRAGRGGVLINPHIGFRGTALQQRASVREWDTAHQPIAVPSQVA